MHFQTVDSAARNPSFPFPFGPFHRYHAMNDKNADTIAPDTDRHARITEPPDELADAEATRIVRTMLPPQGDALAALEPSKDVEKRPSGASREPSDFFERAYNKLVQVHEEQQQEKTALLDPEGGFAKLVTRLVENGTANIVAQLEPRFSGIEQKISKQGEMLYKLEQAYEELKLDTERRLKAFADEIRALKGQRAPEGSAPAAT